MFNRHDFDLKCGGDDALRTQGSVEVSNPSAGIASRSQVETKPPSEPPIEEQTEIAKKVEEMRQVSLYGR
jgi:hypothetical protein